MAEEQGSPTKKTIAPPVSHANEKKSMVEMEMDRLTNAIKKSTAGSKEENNDLVKSLKDTLSMVIVNIKSEDKAVRRQNLMALKQTRAQIATLEDSAFQDKGATIAGIDAVLKAAKHNTSALDGLTQKVGKDLIRAMPTARGFMDAFIKSSNPILLAAMNIAGDVSGMFSGEKKTEEEARKAEIDRSAQFVKSLGGVEEATVKQTTIMSDEALEARKERARKRKAKPGEGPVVKRLMKLTDSTDVQTNLLKAIYEDLSGKKFDIGELVKQDAAILEEYIEGIKDGIMQEGKAKGANPELLKGLIDGINQEAAPILAQLKEQQAGQKNELQKVTEAVEVQTELVKKDIAEKKTKAFKEAAPTKVLGPNLSGGLFKKEEGGITGMIKGFAKNIGGLVTSLFSGIGGFFGKILGVFAKVGGIFKLLGKVSGVFAIFLAVLDFFNGFANADKILGKAEGALTLWDKIASGLGMVVEGFLSIFDWLGTFIGIDGGWSKGISTKVGKFFANLFETIGDIFASVFVGVKTAFNTMSDLFKEYTSPEFWKKKADDALSFLKSIPDMIIEFIKGILRAELSFVPKALRPAWLERALAPAAGTAAPIADSPTVEKKSRAGASSDIKQADNEIDQQETKRLAARSASINSQSSNTVNANTTNYYPTQLKTRNDDDSIRGMNFNWGY